MKKGFTLIELLAVIVILAVIALIAVPIVMGIISDSKNSSLVKSGEFYLDAVTNLMLSTKINKETLDDGTYKIMENGNLCLGTIASEKCEGNLLKVEVKGEAPNSGHLEIKNRRVESAKLIFSDEKIVSKIVGGKIMLSPCVLAKDGDIGEPGLSIGDKYKCKVKDKMENEYKDGYYFNVISFNEDGTTNLIMERNMYYNKSKNVGLVSTEENHGNVEWQSKGSNVYGPVTVMDYLYNATKDWDNVPNINFEYYDEGQNYGSFFSKNGVAEIKKSDGTPIIVLENQKNYKNLKARLPYYNEVYGTDRCRRGQDSFGKCPVWLANYLAPSEYFAGDGIKNIKNINGYWTLSSYNKYTNLAFGVHNNAYIDGFGVRNYGNYGIRPVITVMI